MTSKPGNSEFDTIFARLRTLLRKHAKALAVTEDTPTRYCLTGQVGPAAIRAWGGKRKRPDMPVAWVEVNKAYVSFHLMPVYCNPKALEGMSKELRARMQGKSCFNFKVPNEALFQELEALTARTCQAFKQAGFVV